MFFLFHGVVISDFCSAFRLVVKQITSAIFTPWGKIIFIVIYHAVLTVVNHFLIAFHINYTTVAAYISLFCSYFYSDNKLSVQPITDYAFLIYEFFSSNYSKDLQLHDLAKILYLSERQTERLVIKYTGKTFKNELTTIRMNIAKKLLESSNMSLGEIAQYIGYHSYSGFYKAMKKHKLL